MSHVPLNQKHRCIGMFFIIISTFLAYSNSFEAGWHLDDYDNLLKNPGIHITNLYPKSIIQSFHASIDGLKYKGDSLYRPVPMFTFALNWYWGQNQVWGYHLVNIAVHIITGIFLFFVIRLLLQTPRINLENCTLRYHAALIGALIWVLHPIHISGVTYIVQRMASMAGMFYIIGIYFYFKIRSSKQLSTKLFYTAGYLLSFFLALGTKQNTILLPASTLLIELIFYQRVTSRSLVKPKILLPVIFSCLIMVGYTFVWTKGDLGSLLSGYESRAFTPLERLLTQARIVCFYLYQIFYPVVSQYSIEHDFAISRTLLSPWTTIPSICFLIFLGVSSLLLLKKRPLIAFGILFFFLNHLVESTILNLELVFEHRNYIPSMFLFVPISVWSATVIDRYQAQKDSIRLFFYTFIPVASVIFLLGTGTYLRNADWKTEKTLWESAIIKAPGRARPYQYLATFHYQLLGEWDKSIDLHEEALKSESNNPATSKMVSFDNLRFCYRQKGNFEKAVEYGKKAVDAQPSIVIIYNYIETLFQANKLDTSVSLIMKVLKKNDPVIHELNLGTLIFLKAKKSEAAYENALRTIKEHPFNVDAIGNFGYASLAIRYHSKAEHYLNLAIKQNFAHSLYARLCLIQNSLNQKDIRKAETYAAQLIEKVPLNILEKFLKQVKNYDYPLVSLSIEEISKIISSQLEKKIKDFDNSNS